VPFEKLLNPDIPYYSNLLSHSQLFHAMPPASLADLASQTSVVRSEPELISENESLGRLPGLFVLLEGSVRLAKSGMQLGRGGFFGEAALFEIPRAAAESTGPVRASDSCTCLLISRDQLIAWFQRHPQLEAVFYRHLSAELVERLYLKNELAASA
jgi:CRP-like cAMP-binding protein